MGKNYSIRLEMKNHYSHSNSSDDVEQTEGSYITFLNGLCKIFFSAMAESQEDFTRAATDPQIKLTDMASSLPAASTLS